MGIGSNFSAFCILFHQADEVRMSETSLYCKKIKNKKVSSLSVKSKSLQLEWFKKSLFAKSKHILE